MQDLRGISPFTRADGRVRHAAASDLVIRRGHQSSWVVRKLELQSDGQAVWPM